MSTIFVIGPAGTHSVNVGGEQYNANESGRFEVPESIFELLAPHGFSRAECVAQPVETPKVAVKPVGKPASDKPE